MIVRPADVHDSPAIRTFLEKTVSSSLYHDYRWGVVIGKSFSHASYYLIGEDEGKRICGVLPLVHLRSRIFGNLMVSMPFFNYGGVCAENRLVRTLLIEKAVDIARDTGVSHIEFRQDAPLIDGFPVKTTKASMRLNLPQSADDLWKSFPSKLRSQIKRPQKSGLVSRISGIEGLKNFHKVFSICMRDLGTPVYPVSFFRNIMEQFSDRTWICTVYNGDMPISSGFLIGYKNKMEIPWAGSIKTFNRLSPNMLLYWGCLQHACDKGYAEFDFGRSTIGESTYKFKEQWGAKPFQLYWYYWMSNEGALPDITPGNPKYKFAIEVWKKLPLSVTNVLGPKIVKNIP